MYTEQRQYEYATGLFAPALLGFQIPNLTIIGAHRDSVQLLDPLGVHSSKAQTYGVIASPQASGYRVSGLSVAGVREGFRLLASGSLSSSRASASNIGVLCAESGLIAVEDTETHGAVAGLFAILMEELRVQGLFVNDSVIGIEIQSTSDAQINDAIVVESGLGIQVDASSTAVARGLTVTPTCGNGISLNGGSTLQLRRSFISAFSTSCIGSGASHLDARGTVFDTAFIAFDLTAGTTTQVNHCNIALASISTIRVRSYVGFSPPLSLDFQMNYWGTTDSVVIADSIEDGNDDPAVEATVDFSSMLDVSVPTKTLSVSDIKSRFE